LVTHIILDNSNITAAFKEGGIEDMSSILKLTDVTVENLTFLDPDPNVTMAYILKRERLVFFRPSCTMPIIGKKINDPINDQWLSMTLDEFDQFCGNLKYMRHFATLLNHQHVATTSVTTTAPSATSS
jgi:hypothetical protein